MRKMLSTLAILITLTSLAACETANTETTMAENDAAAVIREPENKNTDVILNTANGSASNDIINSTTK